jgi:transposase
LPFLLARDHGINTNMLFKWRRDLRAGLLAGVVVEGAKLPGTAQ